MKANVGNITPKKLADYCKCHTCQTNCKYNKICWSVFRLKEPCVIYDNLKNNRSSSEFKKLNFLCGMINKNIPNDLNEILKWMG